MEYYKITAEQAKEIGIFEYKKNFFFNPFTKPQKDGAYLLSEAVVNEVEYLSNYGFKTKTSITDDLLEFETENKHTFNKEKLEWESTFSDNKETKKA